MSKDQGWCGSMLPQLKRVMHSWKRFEKRWSAITMFLIASIYNQGGNDELGEMAIIRPTHGGNLGCSSFLGGRSHLQSWSGLERALFKLVILITSQVLSVEESVSTVRFIDYGNTEQKTLKEMFRLVYMYLLFAIRLNLSLLQSHSR